MERTDLGRIMAFTDGVMAVAITLLVLNLEVPDVADDELNDALVDLLPSLYAYAALVRADRPLLGHPPQPFETFVRFDADADGAQPPVPRADRPDAVRHRPARPLHGLRARHGDFSVSVALASLCHWVMATYAVGRASCMRTGSRSTPAAEPSAALTLGLIFLAAAPLAFVARRGGPRAVDLDVPAALPAAQARDLSPAVDDRDLPGHVGPVEREHVLLRLGHKPVAQLHVGEQPLGHRRQRVGVA